MKSALNKSRHTPSGTPELIRFTIGSSSLGSLLIAASMKGICCITLGDDSGPLVADLKKRFKNLNVVEDDDALKKFLTQVIEFVETPRSDLDLPLDVRGTEFQQRVWQALLKIPFGTTTSYSSVAHMIGSPNSVRAVASACGANSISLAIPCHRVVRSDGQLSGYRWGIERKHALLARESNK